MSWPQVPLGEVAEISAGGGAPQDQDDFGDEGHPFIRAGSIKGLVAGSQPNALEHLSPATAAKHGLRLFPLNTVLFAKSGMSAAIGLVHRLSWPAYVVNHLAAVVCGQKLDSSFLYQYIRAFSPARLIQDPAYPSIRLSDIADLKIPLPPLPEQRRIAAILDQADALSAKRREALTQLDSLKQSIFIEMFGDPAINPKSYPTAQLGEYVKVLGGYAFKSEDFAETGFPVIRISNLRGQGIDLSTAVRIPEEKVGKGAGYKINPGDILMAMSGATTGKIGVVPRSLNEPLYLNQRVGNFRIRDIQKINQTFLLSFLCSDYYQKYLWGLAAGAAQPNISGGQLESVTIAIPPIAVQNEFERCVERLGSIGRHMVESENSISELFQSLQYRAFRGDL